jgi:hypothetical protein
VPRYGKGYEHVDDAAAAALMLLERQPRAKDQEYMGLLVRDPETGLVYRTEFQTAGERHTSSWRGTPDHPVAGIVHNHPTMRPHDKTPHTEFSPADLGTAAQLGTPSYVTAMMPKGVARQVKLGRQRKTYDMITDKKQTGVGEEFLAQFPIEEFMQYIARERRAKNPIAAAIIDEHNRMRVASNGNSATR